MNEDRARDNIDFDFFDDDGAESEKVSSNKESAPVRGSVTKDSKEGSARRSRSPSPEDDRSKSRTSDRHAYSDESFDSDSDSESESQHSRRKSSSESEDSDDTRTSTPRNGILKSRTKGGKKRSSSSSENSDDDDDGRTISSRSSAEEESRTVSFSTTTMDSRSTSKKDSRADERRQRQAWGDDSGYSRKRGDKYAAWSEKKPPRPSTAKPSERKFKERDHVKISSEQNKSRSRSHSGSDSEMTDVSPLPSPRESPRQQRRKQQPSGQDSDRSSGSRSRRMVPQYREMPLELEGLMYPGETLDLELLKKAVMDLEKQKRLQANTRRVMFEPPKGKSDRNYTFSRDRAMFIERENQRLLGEILRNNPAKEQQQQQQQQRKKKKAVPTAPVYRMTHSAVNRQREQRKIESENLAFLRRLQKVKPTRGMSRNEQIREYSGTMLFGAPYGALHEMESRKVRSSAPTPAPHEDSLRSGQRTRSMTSLHSAASSTSSRLSRTSRASRSSRTPVDSRPAWDDRW